MLISSVPTVYQILYEMKSVRIYKKYELSVLSFVWRMIILIYITGDMHGDFSRFHDVKKARVKKGDTLIICGDFGFLWEGGKKEEAMLKKIGKLPYQVLFVDGSHENHKLLLSYPETEFAGDHARNLSGSLYLLRRGGIYTIEGKTIFAFGGGISTDENASRKNEEYLLPSAEEIKRASHLLAEHGDKVDFIVTHDAPVRLQRFIDLEDADHLDHLHTFLEEISKTITFKQWYCGKYHLNRKIPPCYHMLFTDVVKAE